MNKEEILDRFFKDELTLAEIKKYRDQGIITDSDIQSFSHLIAALEKKDAEDTRQYLNNLEAQSQPRPKKKVNPYLIIGLLAILLLLGYFILDRIQPAKENLDIAQYAFLYPPDENSRSIDTLSIAESSIVTQAKAYYANSEFEQFISFYEANKSALSKIESQQLQYVSALIALKNYGKVLSVKNDIACQSRECAQNLEWYNMISLIGSGQMEASKKALMDIQTNPNHIFYNDSKRLLEELNQ